MDCPAEKVPQVTSNQDFDRVTVAVLVDFPPKPFYFPSVALIDYVLHYRSKAARKGTLTSGLDLDEDGQWKDARNTYKKLKITTYNHSIPVQELLREHRWEAFQNGLRGNQPNSNIPEGDVRLRGRAAAVPSESTAGIELPPVGAPDSPILRGSVPSIYKRPVPCARLFPPLTKKRQPRIRWKIDSACNHTQDDSTPPGSFRRKACPGHHRYGASGQADSGHDVYCHFQSV